MMTTNQPPSGSFLEYLTIKELSTYLKIPAKTIYFKVSLQQIPYYRVGRLIRFRRDEIDEWLSAFRVDPKVPQKKTPKLRHHTLDIDRLVRKSIDQVNGEGYTASHGKSDQVKGSGKEV